MLSKLALVAPVHNSDRSEKLKIKKDCARLILDATFLARTQALFLELGRPPINQIYIQRRLFILDGLGLDYLSEKL